MARGWRVTGTCRGEDKARALDEQGIAAVLFDGCEPIADIAGHLTPGSHVLSSIPPDAEGDPVVRLHGEELAARAGSLPWVGYLSTTGVYGDRDGDWVDEHSDYRPATERGRLRLRAERQWNRLYAHRTLAVHRFRLAGIYGPGRSPLTRLKKGTARRIDKPGQVFSRIHVDDIVQVLEASMARPSPGRAYNVCDNLAAPPQDVIAYAAELLGLPVPPAVPLEDAGLSDMAASFYAESKRVRNERIKKELGVEFAHPTYKEGLQALLASAAG
jgi:nucleoside-diphosphate-sugar epimerase